VNASIGGAMVITANVKLSVIQSHFVDCSSNLKGGAIFLNGTTNATISSSFQSCYALNGDGGAIYADTNNIALTIIQSNFINSKGIVT
jgi:hypothetical protein